MYDFSDLHSRYNQAAQNARASIAGMPQTPPYLDKSKSLKMMEGAIGGALAGASMGTAFGGGAAPAAGGGGTPTAQPGGFSNPDGSTGVNSGLGSDASMPSPAGPGAGVSGGSWWPKFLGGA